MLVAVSAFILGFGSCAVMTLIKMKPSSTKGIYVKSIYVSSTMSPSVAIDPKV